MQILGRILEKTAAGYAISCSPKLVESILKEEGLIETRGTFLPGDKTRQKEEDDDEHLDEEGHAHYRRQVGKLLWMSVDRLDLQHTVLRLARSVSAPTRGDAGMLKRCLRYLARTRDYRQHLVGDGSWQVVGFADADWAGGDRHDLRSITGGIVKIGGIIVTSFARVQQSTSLSSAEAELMALTAVAAECLFWDGLLREIGFGCTRIPWCHCDSTAALGAAGRRGHKRMKHIELRKLVAQEWQKEGRIAFLKIPTEENEADLLTKWVDIRTLTYLLGRAGVGR